MSSPLWLADFLGVPCLALALAWWARARALACRDDAVTSWFPFARRIELITTLGVLVSMGFGTIGSGVFVPAASPGDVTILARWAQIFLPAVLLRAALSTILHAVARRLGAWDLTWAETRAYVAWSTAAFAAFTLGLIGAALTLPRMFANDWAAPFVWGLSGLAAGVYCSLRRRRAIGLLPHAVTHGELRDRLFAIAARAGIRLRQLYVLPMKRMRLANAFAVRNQTVLVTDLLLENLSRAEVGAVMAHEIGHLRHRHPEKLMAVLIGVALLPVTLGSAFGIGGAGAGLLVALLIAAFISRGFERVADREVTALGENREALVTGLVRVARLSHIPIAWHRSDGWFLTHPSITQRAHDAVRDLGLPAGRASELLAAPTPATERYDIPVASGPSGKLFSTSFKQGVLTRLTLLLITTSLVVPALLDLALPPVAGLWAWLAGLVLTPLACVAVQNLRAAASLRGLRTALRRRLFAAEGEAPVDALLTGLALHSGPRVYEGFANWDLGFTWVAGGRLHYRGEECAFALTPAEVESIETAFGPPAWIRTTVVRIHWRDATGTVRALRLTPLESRTLTGIRRWTTRLFARLRGWHVEARATPPAAVSSPPPDGDVTSSRPDELGKPSAFVQFFVVSALLGVPIAGLLGVSYLPMLATACLSQVVFMWPLMRHREARDSGQATPERERAAA